MPLIYPSDLALQPPPDRSAAFPPLSDSHAAAERLSTAVEGLSTAVEGLSTAVERLSTAAPLDAPGRIPPPSDSASPRHTTAKDRRYVLPQTACVAEKSLRVRGVATGRDPRS